MIGVHPGDPKVAADGLERRLGRAQILLGDREGDLRVASLTERLVLDDRVDVAAGVGQRPEDRSGGARPIGHAEQGDPGLLGRVGDSGDQWVFHGFLFSQHNGTRRVFKARATVDPNPVGAGVLHRAQLQHLCPGGSHLEHLLEADVGELAGVRHEPGVRGEHTRHVAVDLAHLRVDRGGQRDGCGVRAAASQRGHVAAGGDALEPRHQHDPILAQGLADAIRADVEDLRLGVGGVGHDPGLRPGQRDRPMAQVVDRHRA